MSALRLLLAAAAFATQAVHAAEPAFTALAPFPPKAVKELKSAAQKFALADGERVKAIEAKTNHDVKAVEYWLRERFAGSREITAA